MSLHVPVNYYSMYYDYTFVDKTYHKKGRYSECSQCGSIETVGNNEKHTYLYKKDGDYISYECSACNYVYDHRFIKATGTLKATLKKGKKKDIAISKTGLHNDTIKKYKITSGKKSISIKRNSKTKLSMKAKKKGTAKVKLLLKSGAVYNYVIKVK